MRKRYIFIGVLAVIAVLASVATGIVVASTALDMTPKSNRLVLYKTSSPFRQQLKILISVK